MSFMLENKVKVALLSDFFMENDVFLFVV